MAGDILNNSENAEQGNSLAEAWEAAMAEAPTQTAEEEQTQEQIYARRVDSLAIPLARDYAKKNYEEIGDGVFKPCWRGNNGEKEFRDKSPKMLVDEGYFGTEEEAREHLTDLANDSFDQYSEHWKEANRGAARFLIDMTDRTPGAKSEILSADFENDKAMRSKYGTLVHENWMERNPWDKDKRPDLFVPFDNLVPAEQQKDIDQLVILKDFLEQEAAGESEA